MLTAALKVNIKDHKTLGLGPSGQEFVYCATIWSVIKIATEIITYGVLEV